MAELSNTAEYHRVDGNNNNFSSLVKIEQLILPSSENPKVLDVGCGNGDIPRELTNQSYQVTGIDIALNISSDIKIINSDIEGVWPVQNDSFDQVLCLDILEHLYNLTHVLEEARRVLRVEGAIIIAFPNHFDLRGRWEILRGRGIVHWSHRQYSNARAFDYAHIRFLRVEELMNLIKQTGFNIDVAQFNFMGGGIMPRRYTPKFIRSILLRLWPNLFSGKFIIRARKGMHTDKVKKIFLTTTPLGL